MYTIMKTKKIKELNQISGVANAILNFIFIIFMLICVLPFILVVIVSLTDQQSIVTQGYSFFPEKISTLSYEYLFKNPTLILRAYSVSIFVTVVGTVVNVIISSMFAYPLSRRDFPFRKFFTIMITITMLFSGGMVPSYIIYATVLHIKNNILALILPGLFSPFYVIMIRTFIKSNVPDSIIESAKIDGASEFRIYWRIVLPLSVPVLASIGLFTSIFYWNDYFNCLMYITSEKLFNLQFVMMKAMLTLEFIRTHISVAVHLDTTTLALPAEGVRMAMAVVAIGPIILAYPFFQRFFIKGLTVGAVKG